MNEYEEQVDPALRDLADRFGIATDFWDWQGGHVDVAADTIVAALRAFGVDASTHETARRALEDHRLANWVRMLPPCLVTREGRSPSVWVHVPHGSAVHVWVELEDGTRRDHLVQIEDFARPQEIDGVLVGQASFAVPSDLPLGYHTLRAAVTDGAGADATSADLVSRDLAASMPLIVTPSWVGLPERLGARRAWGLAAQLYSVRSRASWGLGDLADLADLAVWSAARHGADYILINPVHAAQPVARMEPSTAPRSS